MTKTERLEEIDVVRIENGRVHVLGRSGKFSKCLNHMVHDITSGEIIAEDSFDRKNSEDLFFSGLFSLYGGLGIPFLIYNLMPKQCERRGKTKEYDGKVKLFQEINMDDLRKAVKDIRVYQGDKIPNRDFGLVDTEKPEAFINAEDTFWLRAKAYSLGANAVINYQPGSSVGTPVKYLDKE